MRFAWEELIIIAFGMILLRISGRKSIAQMTIAQTMVMISIGTIIVHPILETSLLKTLIAASILFSALILMEWIQVKVNWIEFFLTGKSKFVIEDGQLNIENLKKLRLTADQLEMRLRLLGISNINTIKYATLEANGQLGYELKDDCKPLTIKDLKNVIDPKCLNKEPRPQKDDQANIFEEIKKHQTQHKPKNLE
ncbi:MULTISPECIES: DUF421 domain-containing protein [Bacillus]|uniref:DUF421 domain-containing protein n=1 Tax=Bacillus TaxID=1386 RepID=UPI000BA7CC5B|nr:MULTISPECIES: YetF domain-containing protein [Bacillus]MDU0074826.1 DUF421 domain-containing protein [Bacillus sp. IG2]MDU0100536.1 DUF421 domain-containing protein [Bacillus sp. IS1]MEC2272801.1 DUF421 domain-containing protein [Bacillus velezensis]MED3680977.1 DUF421 domain-containing protein [Bacillus velezensis]PAF00653.1 hypothetical protein CHH68_11945 [Bacillus velezensis]